MQYEPRVVIEYGTLIHLENDCYSVKNGRWWYDSTLSIAPFRFRFFMT